MANKQYVGARYVPKFATPVEWNNSLSYEALTIVTHLGNSFTSKKPVPAGIDIGNTEYWVNTGNYNAQVEEYRQKVEELIATKLFGKNTVSVGSNGEQYKTITEAFNAVKDKLNSVILISPGVYNEAIDARYGTVHFIGLGRVRVLSNVDYPMCPIYAGGSNTFENISFENGGKSYACHIEASNYPIDYTLAPRFINCSFINYNDQNTPAIGVGTGNNSDIVFKNCYISSNGKGIYAHNDSRDEATTASILTVDSCTFTTVNESVLIENVNKNSGLILNFTGSTANNKTVYQPDTRTGPSQGYVPTTGNVRISEFSTPVNIIGVDANNNTFDISAEGETTSGGVFSIPLNDANKYNFTVKQATIDNSPIDVSGVAVGEGSKTNVGLFISGQANKSCKIVLTAMAK